MEVTAQNKKRLGFILGSNKVDLKDLFRLEPHDMETKFGTSFFWAAKNDGPVILPRHGKENDIPPHMINYRANILGFLELGVGNIISFTSVGSLKLELEPGKIIIPSDYINFGKIPTFFDNKICHIIPTLDNNLRDLIINIMNKLSIQAEMGGIYIQTKGPRFETKAEIQMFKSFGDIMGMTMAMEATLAKELNINYANVSIVDNYCNGISNMPLTIEAIKENQQKNSRIVRNIIKELQSVKEW